MQINADLYRIFAEVVRMGTFSGAAKELGISQPAISQSIGQLERQLGAKLFMRSSRGVTLTREGEMLIGYVNSAMGLLEAGEERLGKLQELSAGELRIGASDTVAKWYLPRLIGKYHNQYPEVKISMINRTSDGTLELLNNGVIDIGFVNMPVSAKGFVFEECLPVHDIFIAGERFSYLSRRAITLEEISRLPLIMLEQASNSRRRVDRHFLSNGVVLQPEIELGAHDLLAEYARIGLGVACAIKEFVAKDAGVFEVRLTNPVPRRSIAVCYSENIELPAAVRRFVEMVRGE